MTLYSRVYEALRLSKMDQSHVFGADGPPGPCAPHCRRCELESLLTVMDGGMVVTAAGQASPPAAPFKVGDAVMLGGPDGPGQIIAGPMSVVEVEDAGGGTVFCVWFDRDLHVQHRGFPPACLVRVRS